jgi:hypothetical protein
MDLFLGVPSVLIDSDVDRRKLYGKAGCFRFTEFGVEYRVMSGYFLDNKDLTLWMFNQAFEAINYLNEFGIEAIESEKDTICDVINNGNKEKAIELVNKYNLKLI